MIDHDHTTALQVAVHAALQSGAPLRIHAGGSKHFYGCASAGEALDVSLHQGIVSYHPSELVVTARAGTPLATLEYILNENHQMLPFEPPHFGIHATIGGTIACGLSGPRRPWGGAARDLVLGVRIINGRGELLRFGGQVMKNVAGYDVSRLMVGALGTLGVMLDISLKVLPKPETEITLAFAMSAQRALDEIGRIGAATHLLSAAMHVDNYLFLRLSGAHAGVRAARARLGGEQLRDNHAWRELREHRLDFFTQGTGNLWRLSLPPATPALVTSGAQLIDWGGAQRWTFSVGDEQLIRTLAASHAGHATCFRRAEHSQVRAVFHPLNSVQARLHRAVKDAFDPQGIFNPGRFGIEKPV